MEEFLAVSAICAATSTQAGEMVKTKGGSVESLSAIFNLLDKDGSGVISKEELDQANFLLPPFDYNLNLWGKGGQFIDFTLFNNSACLHRFWTSYLKSHLKFQTSPRRIYQRASLMNWTQTKTGELAKRSSSPYLWRLKAKSIPTFWFKKPNQSSYK